jgi:hypothetical protein
MNISVRLSDYLSCFLYWGRRWRIISRCSLFKSVHAISVDLKAVCTSAVVLRLPSVYSRQSRLLTPLLNLQIYRNFDSVEIVSVQLNLPYQHSAIWTVDDAALRYPTLK